MNGDAFSAIAEQIDGLTRRVAILEGTNPGGWSEAQWSTVSGTWTQTPPPGLNVFEDDAGGATPAAVIVQDCPGRVLVYATAYVNNLSSDATFASRRVRMGVDIDGTDPASHTVSDTAGTSLYADVLNNNAGNWEGDLKVLSIRNDLTAGDDVTFTQQFAGLLQNASAANDVIWARMALVVVPLGPTGG